MYTLRTLIKEQEIPAYSTSLERDIVQSIFLLSEKELRQQKYIYTFGIAFSFAGLLLSGFFFGGTLIQSEFWSIVSIFFSDISSVTNYLGDFILLLLETLPIIPLLAFFVPIFFVCIFLSLLFSQTKSMQRLSY